MTRPGHKTEDYFKPSEKLSKAELKWARERIKHYGPKGPELIAKEFKSKHEREAIAAVFNWLDLNSVVGWYFKSSRSHVSTIARSATVRRDGRSDVLVMEESVYDAAKKILCGEIKK